MLGSVLGPLLGLADKFFDYKTTQLTTTADVEKTQITAMSAVEQRWPFVALMIPVMSMPYAVWLWKAIVVDKIINDGTTSTDSLGGPLGYGFTIVLSGLFLHAIGTINAR